MPGCFLEQFDAILLDMGNTFMFGCDRFTDDMAATYRCIGGRTLAADEVRCILATAMQNMLVMGRDPDRWECFPTVRQYLGSVPAWQALPPGELDLLAQVVALHEVGAIPETHAHELRQLRELKPLGVISNVWSDSAVFLEAFDRADIRRLMQVIVFSSDHGCLKPSTRLFDRAVEALSYPRSRLVYVGDKHHRDIVGAKAAGMAAVWINAEGVPVPPEGAQPDLVIGDLRELRSR